MCEMKGKENKMYFKYNQHHQPSAAYSQNTFVVIVFIDCYYYYYNRQSNIIESARRSAQPPTFHVPRHGDFQFDLWFFQFLSFYQSNGTKNNKTFTSFKHKPSPELSIHKRRGIPAHQKVRWTVNTVNNPKPK